jgi:hypothetical protein
MDTNMMHKNTLKIVVGASVLTVLALGWVPPAATQGNQRPWYESPTTPMQEKLVDELKRDGVLKPGWNDRPASVEVGEEMAESLRRMDALGPACRSGNTQACAELRQIRDLETRRSREIQQAIGVMAAENERLERSNQLRRSELTQRYRTQAIELRGLADRYDIIAEQSFLNDDFAAGRYFREQAAMLRQQAEQLNSR